MHGLAISVEQSVVRRSRLQRLGRRPRQSWPRQSEAARTTAAGCGGPAGATWRRWWPASPGRRVKKKNAASGSSTGHRGERRCPARRVRPDDSSTSNQASLASRVPLTMRSPVTTWRRCQPAHAVATRATMSTMSNPTHVVRHSRARWTLGQRHRQPHRPRHEHHRARSAVTVSTSRRRRWIPLRRDRQPRADRPRPASAPAAARSAGRHGDDVVTGHAAVPVAHGCDGLGGAPSISKPTSST